MANIKTARRTFWTMCDPWSLNEIFDAVSGLYAFVAYTYGETNAEAETAGALYRFGWSKHDADTAVRWVIDNK